MQLNATSQMIKQVCLTERNREMPTKAGTRARHTEPAIVGFALGCALGAACEVIVGLWSLALPTGLALVALTTGRLHVRRAKGGDASVHPISAREAGRCASSYAKPQGRPRSLSRNVAHLFP
jgi:hypothetical protein